MNSPPPFLVVLDACRHNAMLCALRFKPSAGRRRSCMHWSYRALLRVLQSTVGREHHSRCCGPLLTMVDPQQQTLLLPGSIHGDAPISHKAANQCLKNWRAWMSAEGRDIRIWDADLTHDEGFDWKRYLSHHPQKELLIGTGVIKFEVRFLNGWDPNMKQHRCDFVVHRNDGTHARLHPSSSQAGHIVTGSLQNWLLEGYNEPLLLERDIGAAEHNVTAFRTLHQVDTISRREAQAFIEKNVAHWQAQEHPRREFYLDLRQHPGGHGDFRRFLWSHYLNSTDWGRQIVLNVSSFYLVWLESKNRVGFWIRLLDGTSGTIDVLGDARCPIKWNAEADEVSWK